MREEWLDETDGRQAQEERARLLAREREARAAAEAAEARLRAVLESAPHGILFVEVESGRLNANPEAVRLLGRELDDGAGLEQYADLVRAPDGGLLPAEEWPLSRALRGEVVQDEEFLVARPDGRCVSVLVSAAPVRGSGEPAGVVVTFQDISALKELERLREEWASVIAHDLRQPLSVITYSAGLLRRMLGKEVHFDVWRTLEDVLVAAGNLNKMVNDLLDVSHLEARRLSLEWQPVDLPALVREAVGRMVWMTGERRVRVEARGEVWGEVPPVLADPGRVEQVLGNLLSNAAKYGYPDAEILVEVAREAEGARVSVRNRGPGIPPEKLPRLFTRFYRAGADQEVRTGLGLGLYISKGLVEAHGGRLWAESAPGFTTFHFTLPTDTFS